METTLLTELFKYGGLVGLLAYMLFIIWKRYDRFTDRTQKELELLRQEIKDYMNNDRLKMEQILVENTKAFERNTEAFNNVIQVTEENSRVTRCLMKEIQVVKNSEFFSNWEATKK